MQFTCVVNYTFIEVIIKGAARREGYLNKNASYKSLQTDISKSFFYNRSRHTAIASKTSPK